MMRQFALATAVAASLGLVNLTPAVADDGPPQPSAAYAGHLVAGPGAVTVSITYTCDASVSPANHLFVAVKQGPQIDTDEHSSSDFAVSFYSTNWKSDSGPNALVCDGTSHTQTVVLKKQPVFMWPPSATQPPFHTGLALVQVCVFDNMVGDPDDPNATAGFALSYTMEAVHAGNGVH
ncbi:MAG: hypothetical protein QOC82_531 [Frankiaceae bacterium]|jgi:hypothetical protein|nr:hypothetical protein [Frankiaceae bacterium]